MTDSHGQPTTVHQQQMEDQGKQGTLVKKGMKKAEVLHAFWHWFFTGKVGFQAFRVPVDMSCSMENSNQVWRKKLSHWAGSNTGADYLRTHPKITWTPWQRGQTAKLDQALMLHCQLRLHVRIRSFLSHSAIKQFRVAGWFLSIWDERPDGRRRWGQEA